MKTYIGIITLFILVSCTSNKYIGTYKSSDNICLIIDLQNFLLIDKTDNVNYPFKCCDTITYGEWKKESDVFLSFTSPQILDTYYINAIVKESHIDGDSLYFYFDNPIEKHYTKFHEKNREFYYSIEVFSNNSDFDVKLTQEKWENNSFKIYKPKDLVIDKFEIVIIPKSNMRVRSVEAKMIYTLPYNVKDGDNNSFNINMPSLTYQYISLIRLQQEFVKIEGDKILWNGKSYIRDLR